MMIINQGLFSSRGWALLIFCISEILEKEEQVPGE